MCQNVKMITHLIPFIFILSTPCYFPRQRTHHVTFSERQAYPQNQDIVLGVPVGHPPPVHLQQPLAIHLSARQVRQRVHHHQPRHHHLRQEGPQASKQVLGDRCVSVLELLLKDDVGHEYRVLVLGVLLSGRQDVVGLGVSAGDGEEGRRVKGGAEEGSSGCVTARRIAFESG